MKRNNKIVKKLTCTVEGCEYYFSSRKVLNKHFKIWHANLVTSYTCSSCSKTFEDICNYKRHLKIHRSMMDVECPFCKRNSLKYNLARHIRTFHGPRMVVTAIIEEIISTIIKSTQTQSTPTITQMQITPTNTLTHCTPTNTQTQNTPTNTQTESTPTNTQTQSTPTKTQTQSTLTNTQTQSTPANAQTESTLTNTQTRSTTTSNPAPSHHHQTANPEVQGEDTPGSDDEGRHLVPLQAITNRAQFVCNICAHTCGSSNHLRRHHDSMHAETGVTCSRNFCEQVLPTKYMMLKHLSECYIYCNWDSCTKRFKYKKKFEAHQRAHRNLMRRYN